MKFEPRDLWVGVFWKVDMDRFGYNLEQTLHIYICLLPCLPVILEFTTKVEPYRRLPK